MMNSRDSVSLDSVVDDWANRSPDGEACRDCMDSPDTSKPYTYSDLRNVSRQIARSLEFHLKSGCDIPKIAICMQRGFLWYATYIAAIRLRVPVVPMTCDIPDLQARDSRNDSIIDQLNPSIIVVDSSSPTSVAARSVSRGILVIHISDLTTPPTSPISSSPLTSRPTVSTPLGYVFTGGTTRASKCAIISHAMAMHEMHAYPMVAPNITTRDRVIQHSSTYWGATFLGQINIALSFGASVVFTRNQTDLTSTIDAERITVLGLVPSQLGAVSGSIPSVHTVFTWGEKLIKIERVKKFLSSEKIIIELLVSTEYWLCLYAVNGEDTFRVLDIDSVRIRFNPVPSSGSADVGELMIGGDCVTPFGYTEVALNDSAFLRVEGEQYFRTNDLVKQEADGRLRFMGRSDSMIKIGGEWRDLFAIQDQLAGIAGVVDVSVLPEEGVFVATSSSIDEVGINAIRKICVGDNFLNLHFLKSIPRHSVTGKVDRKRLTELVTTQAPVGKDEGIAKTRRVHTTCVWLSLTIFTVLLLWLTRGLFPLITLPFIHQFFIRFHYSSAWHGASLYSAVLRYVPSNALGCSVLCALLLPAILSHAIGITGLVLLYRAYSPIASAAFAELCFSWTITFWLGLGRQLELALPDFAKIDHTKRRGPSAPKCDACNEGRVMRKWNPFGQSIAKHKERGLATFEHSTIELSEHEVDSIANQLPPVTHNSAAMTQLSPLSPLSPEQEEVVEIINEVCGEFIQHPIGADTTLTALNSLAAVELTHRIRESCGCQIGVNQVLRSATVKDLLNAIALSPQIPSTSEDPPLKAPPSTAPSREVLYKCQLWGWGFPCTWVFELVSPPTLDFTSIHFKTIQTVVATLANRHPALRATLVDPHACHYWMNETLVVLGLYRDWASRMFPRPSLLSKLTSLILRWLGECVFESWNRVKTSPVRHLPKVGWQTFRSESEMRQYLITSKRKPYFRPPFQVDVLALDDGRQFVRMYVTHAFSDGFSVVPLAKEFNALYTDAMVNWGQIGGVELGPVPPHAMKKQQERLHQSLTESVGERRADSFYLCYNMDMDVVGESFGRIVVLRESFVVVAQRAALRLSVPIDLLLLAGISIALARLWHWEHLVELALIVPLRDGAHETQIVGFLADQRNLDIPLLNGPLAHQYCTILSVVQTLQNLRRHRAWKIPDPFTNCQRTLVNIIQSSFPDNVPFHQELILQQHEFNSGTLYRPMEVYLEQIDKNLWSMKARCRMREYTPEKFEEFTRLFRESIIQLLVEPNTLLHDRK